MQVAVSRVTDCVASLLREDFGLRFILFIVKFSTRAVWHFSADRTVLDGRKMKVSQLVEAVVILNQRIKYHSSVKVSSIKYDTL